MEWSGTDHTFALLRSRLGAPDRAVNSRSIRWLAIPFGSRADVKRIPANRASPSQVSTRKRELNCPLRDSIAAEAGNYPLVGLSRLIADQLAECCEYLVSQFLR